MTVPDTPSNYQERWVVVTCMGRLAFLRQTMQQVLDSTRWNYCLVDYSCPDECGAWAARTFPTECAQGRVVIVHVPGRATFHKTIALNAGALRAIAGGARQLCFLDADTRVSPAFGDCLDANSRAGRFLITFGRSLTGFLVVPAQDWSRLGGYDEQFVNWGAEDYEMRVRLRVVGRLSYVAISPGLLTSLPHDNELRVRHYAEKNLLASNRSNYARLRRKVHEWTGTDLWSLEPSVRQLCRSAPVRSTPASASLVRLKQAPQQPAPRQPRVRRVWG